MGIQFYNTSSVYVLCVHHPKSSSVTIYIPFTLFYIVPHPFPLVIAILLLVSEFWVALAQSLHLVPQPLTTLPMTAINLFAIYESVSILLLHSLDSTYK